MDPRKDLSTKTRFASITAGLLFLLLLLLPSVTSAQQSPTPKRILVLYWYNKDYPWNIGFDQGFQSALQSAAAQTAQTVEYYPEYLESNRFPGENQSLLLLDYLRQKYRDRTIDVVVANSDASLNFLQKYRYSLFPNTPIVFVAATPPTIREREGGAGITGVININTHRPTLDLALRLHPQTERVFVVSGTLDHDKRFEMRAREELRGYESRIEISYFTDLPPGELMAKVSSLPERSIILYAWQQSLNEQGKVLESADILSLITRSARTPIYGMSTAPGIGSGLIGGYITTSVSTGSEVAEIALRIANGERAQDIPVENASAVPIFDWHELRRWHIDEDLLPADSIVRFKELSFWELQKWRIIGAFALFVVQAFLIAVLLLERRRRQSASQSLRKSEQRNREILENANDIIYTHDPFGTFTSLNKMGEMLSGYTRDEAVRLNIAQIVAPEYLDLARSMIERKIANKDATTYELEIIAKDGHRVALEVSTRLIYDGDKAVEVQGIGRDITDRKRAAADILEWKNRYEAAVQSSNQILYDWDPRTNDVTYGGDIERILGYSPEELTGGIHEWIAFVHPDDRTEFQKEIERVIATEDSFHLTYRVCRRDGTIIWVEDSGHFFRDSANQIMRMVGLVADITERRRAEELIRQINAELERRVAQRTSALDAKSRELESFAYSVAHDLKAPLRGIGGYSRLMFEGYADDLDDEGRSFLKAIQASTMQMNQLIEDLLAYSRLERREMKQEGLELGPIIESLVEQKKHEADLRTIDFVLNVNGGKVVADARGLTQALRNYLDNAIKFTRDTASPRIEVGARGSETGCRIWVRDNGVGFDMRYHDQIFEIFQRLHIDEDDAGTGVGLAIVRKAMERMGGRAWAESQPGCGATFYLEIPQ